MLLLCCHFDATLLPLCCHSAAALLSLNISTNWYCLCDELAPTNDSADPAVHTTTSSLRADAPQSAREWSKTSEAPLHSKHNYFPMHKSIGLGRGKTEIVTHLQIIACSFTKEHTSKQNTMMRSN